MTDKLDTSSEHKIDVDELMKILKEHDEYIEKVLHNVMKSDTMSCFMFGFSPEFWDEIASSGGGTNDMTDDLKNIDCHIHAIKRYNNPIDTTKALAKLRRICENYTPVIR